MQRVLLRSLSAASASAAPSTALKLRLRLRLAGVPRRADVLRRHGGPSQVVKKLEEYGPLLGKDFTISPLLRQLGADGKRFQNLK